MIKQHHTRLSKSPKRLLTVACSAAIAAGFNSLPTIAQTELALEEVIVTATRRDESLQDVAVSVSAIDPETRTKRTVRRLDDLQTFSAQHFTSDDTPGLPVAQVYHDPRYRYSLTSDKSLDPPIGVMMDGVFLGTASGVLMQNFDIQRIEMLRGPQGTFSVRIRPAV